MSEEFMLEMIETYPFPGKGKVAFDLGANKGDYTEILARKFERVYAFEPFPENIEHLRQRFANFPQVIIVPKAVFHKTGTGKLYLNGKNTEASLSTIFAQAGAWNYRVNDYIEVETITLDDFCIQEKIDNVAFIKVDVEGAEHFLFRGATTTLTTRMDPTTSWIAIEAHLLVDWDAVNELFTSLGYHFLTTGFKPIDEMVPGEHFLIYRGKLNFKTVVLVDE